MMTSQRKPRRRDDVPHVLTSRADLTAQVATHKATYGCPGDASLYQQSCPCGRKVVVMCGACDTAVIMMASKRRCHHEFVYHMEDGSTARPFEGY